MFFIPLVRISENIGDAIISLTAQLKHTFIHENQMTTVDNLLWDTYFFVFIATSRILKFRRSFRRRITCIVGSALHFLLHIRESSAVRRADFAFKHFRRGASLARSCYFKHILAIYLRAIGLCSSFFFSLYVQRLWFT